MVSSSETGDEGWETVVSKSVQRRQARLAQIQQQQRDDEKHSSSRGGGSKKKKPHKKNQQDLNNENTAKRNNVTKKKKPLSIDEISAKMLPSAPAPKAKKSKKQHTNKTTTQVKQKHKKHNLKEIRDILSAQKIHLAIDAARNKYPDNEGVQIEDLAGFFAEEFSIFEFNSAVLSQHQSFADFIESPLCFVRDECYKELADFLENIEFTNIFTTFKFILQNLLNESGNTNGVEVGLQLFIQFLIKTHPMEFLATADLIKSMFSPSKSGRIRDLRAFKQYIWLVAQAAPVSPLDALKDWALEFFPILHQEHLKREERQLIFELAHFILDHKVNTEEKERWLTSPISCDIFVTIIEEAFGPGPMNQEFLNLYPTLLPRCILLNRKCKEEAFEYFLEKLNLILDPEPKDQVKKLLVYCLEENSCFQVWQEIYWANISESRELIEFILQAENWKIISDKLNHKKLALTLDKFLHTNNSILEDYENGEREELTDISRKTQELRNRLGDGNLCRYIVGTICALLITCIVAVVASLFVDQK